MQEEHEVHAHLRDRQHDKCHWDARLPNQIGAGDKERGRRQQDGEPQSNQIAEDPRSDAICYVLIARCDIGVVEDVHESSIERFGEGKTAKRPPVL